MRKKMNRLIDRLCQQGVLEKVSVPGTSKTHKDSRLHCVRLLDMGAGGAPALLMLRSKQLLTIAQNKRRRRTTLTSLVATKRRW